MKMALFQLQLPLWLPFINVDNANTPDGKLMITFKQPLTYLDHTFRPINLLLLSLLLLISPTIFFWLFLKIKCQP